MANLDETLSMLKDLTEAKGISGNEKEARDVMEKYITPYADEVFTDNIGSLIAKRSEMKTGQRLWLLVT